MSDAMKLSRSVLTKDERGVECVQLVRQGDGMATAGIVGVIYDHECNAEAVAEKIVALWNAAP